MTIFIGPTFCQVVVENNGNMEYGNILFCLVLIMDRATNGSLVPGMYGIPLRGWIPYSKENDLYSESEKLLL